MNLTNQILSKMSHTRKKVSPVGFHLYEVFKKPDRPNKSESWDNGYLWEDENNWKRHKEAFDNVAADNVLFLVCL